MASAVDRERARQGLPPVHAAIPSKIGVRSHAAAAHADKIAADREQDAAHKHATKAHVHASLDKLKGARQLEKSAAKEKMAERVRQMELREHRGNAVLHRRVLIDTDLGDSFDAEAAATGLKAAQAQTTGFLQAKAKAAAEAETAELERPKALDLLEAAAVGSLTDTLSLLQLGETEREADGAEDDGEGRKGEPGRVPGHATRDALLRTPLHYAATFGHCEVARHLLLAGADVDACDAEGFTSLHFASRWNRLEMVELLFHNDARPSLIDGEGRTALHIAAFFGCTEAAAALVEYGASAEQPDLHGLLPAEVALDAETADAIAGLVPSRTRQAPPQQRQEQEDPDLQALAFAIALQDEYEDGRYLLGELQDEQVAPLLIGRQYLCLGCTPNADEESGGFCRPCASACHTKLTCHVVLNTRKAVFVCVCSLEADCCGSEGHLLPELEEG